MALGFAVGSSSVAVAGAEPTTGQNIKAYEQCLRRVEYPSLDLAPPLATSGRTEDAAEKRRWPGPPTTGAALPGTGAGTPT